jgi:hypothetical protein
MHDAIPAPGDAQQNIENNPMHSSGMIDSQFQKISFDSSGKSLAIVHHRAIWKTSMVRPGNGLFGAIAGRDPHHK